MMSIFSQITSNWRSNPRKYRNGPPTHAQSHMRGVIDVGTSMVRFGVFEVAHQDIILRGYARVDQLPNAMAGGVIIDIERVMEAVARAAELAMVNTNMPVEHVVAGIAGELVRGSTLSATVERPSPEKRITESELQQLIDVLERKASYNARKTIAEEQGLSEVDLRILHAALMRMSIDGHIVANPLHFQGRMVELTAYHGFAPLVHLGAIQTVLRNLGFSVESIIAEPYALSSAVLTSEKNKMDDVLIVDIGAGTTDIALIRSGGIEATRSYACAGDAFTLHLASALGLSIEDAEKKKRAYALGDLSQQQKKTIQKPIDRVLGLWKRGFVIACEELSNGLPLPTRIMLSGGGALLPDIHAILEGPWKGVGGIYGPMTIQKLSTDDIGVRDPQGLARDHRDMTALALASVLQSRPAESIAERLFDRIQRLLKS